MTPGQFKIYENKVRRWADRQGLMLVKSFRQDPRSLGYDQYMLVEFEALIRYAHEKMRRGEGKTLQEIERELGYAEEAA